MNILVEIFSKFKKLIYGPFYNHRNIQHNYYIIIMQFFVIIILFIVKKKCILSFFSFLHYWHDMLQMIFFVYEKF